MSLDDYTDSKLIDNNTLKSAKATMKGKSKNIGTERMTTQDSPPTAKSTIQRP